MPRRGTQRPNAFVTVMVTTDGGMTLEEEIRWNRFNPVSEALAQIKYADLMNSAALHAAESGEFVAVWCLQHDHPPLEDGCECIQYLQDHNPSVTFNKPSE